MSLIVSAWFICFLSFVGWRVAPLVPSYYTNLFCIFDHKSNVGQRGRLTTHPPFGYIYTSLPRRKARAKKNPTNQNLGEQNRKIPYSPSSHIEEARPTNPE